MSARPAIRFRDKYFGEARTDYGEAQSQGDRDYQEDFQGVAFGVNATRPSGAKRGSSLVDDILLVLADGMGGQNAGDVASHLAVEQFMQAYAGSDGAPGARLEHALLAANRALTEAMAADPRLKGMGCTLVALVVDQGQAHFISVGDSLLWRWRDGTLTRLNDDHSYGAVLDELARRGEITREKAETSPDRSLLRSALTGGRIEEISRSEQPLEVADGDVFLLASDGLLTLPETAVAAVLARGQAPAHLARELIGRVEQVGQPDQDNTTVQVLRCAVQGRAARIIPWRAALGALVVLVLLGLGIWLGPRWLDRGGIDLPFDPFAAQHGRGDGRVSPMPQEKAGSQPSSQGAGKPLADPAVSGSTAAAETLPESPIVEKTSTDSENFTPAEPSSGHMGASQRHRPDSTSEASAFDVSRYAPPGEVQDESSSLDGSNESLNDGPPSSEADQ